MASIAQSALSRSIPVSWDEYNKWVQERLSKLAAAALVAHAKGRAAIADASPDQDESGTQLGHSTFICFEDQATGDKRTFRFAVQWTLVQVA